MFRGTFLFFYFLPFFIIGGGGGGLPNTKLFEGLFCLYLEIFQERGGGPCSKTFEELFA
jgi:hypothetical protein